MTSHNLGEGYWGTEMNNFDTIRGTAWVWIPTTSMRGNAIKYQGQLGSWFQYWALSNF